MSVETDTSNSDTAIADSKDVIETVQHTELPDRVRDLIDEYEAVCGDRDRFLWQWIYALFPSFTLSCVDPTHREHVRTQKTILTVYVTVLDDLVENHGDRETFAEARRLADDSIEPDPSRAAVDAKYFAFIDRVWEAFKSGIEGAPRADAFADVFAYDLKQTANAMEYSAVLNDNPAIANRQGTERYDAHNMAMFAYADVDLMYSTDFDLAEFGAVRDLLWDLQELARIGNWVTTWEREVHEGDYTAGIVVLALQEGIVTPAELRGGDPNALIANIRAAGIERRFRDQWRDGYRAVQDRTFETESVDLAALVEGMETVYQYHLATRGYK